MFETKPGCNILQANFDFTGFDIRHDLFLKILSTPDQFRLNKT